MKRLTQLWTIAIAAIVCLSPTYADAQDKFEVRIGTGNSQILVEDDGPRDQDKKANTIFFEEEVRFGGGKRFIVSMRVSQKIVPGKSADLKLGPITISNTGPVPLTDESILITSSKFAPIGPPFVGRVHLSGRYYTRIKALIQNADIFLQGSVFPVDESELPKLIGTIDPPKVVAVKPDDAKAKFRSPDKTKKFDFEVVRLDNFLMFSLASNDRIRLEDSAIVSGYTAERIFVVNSTLDLDDGDTSDGICDIGSGNSNHPNFPLKDVCTLRAALIESEFGDNLTPAPNAIHFNISGEGVPIIRVSENLSFNRGRLGALRPVFIDGTTQPVGLVELDGSEAAENDIAGNPIVGLDLVGEDIMVRGLVITGFPAHGIQIRPTTFDFGGNILIEGNFVKGSQGDGVHIFQMPNNTIVDNFIDDNRGHGVTIAGLDGKGNRVLGNFISMNGDLGINLTGSANNQQDIPVLTSIISDGDSVTFQGTISSTPDATVILQFFTNSECDPSGFGEGEDYIGRTEVTSNAGGNANFNVSLPANIPVDQFSTATATDLEGNTSEFSECASVAVNQPPVADAGPDSRVLVGTLIILNGSGSFDPDNGPAPLSFSWVQTTGPAVTLTGATSETPSFTPTEAESYSFSLVVNDGQADSAPDSVLITVLSQQDAIQNLISKVQSLGFPKGLENSLISKLAAAIASLDRDNTRAAGKQLQAFLNQVKAQRGKKITEQQAAELITSAQDIQ